jgi:hypothetical protein
LALLFVGEDQRAQCLAVQGAVRVKNFRAKRVDDRLQTGRPRPHDFACGVIGIDYVTAEFNEDRRDKRLAHGDRSCKAHA